MQSLVYTGSMTIGVLAISTIVMAVPVLLRVFVTDTRIIDMHVWKRESNDPNHQIVSYRRLLVRRLATDQPEEQPEEQLPQTPGILRFQKFVLIRDTSMRLDTEALNPIFRMKPHTLPTGKQGYLAEVELDLSSVPVGKDFAFGFEIMTPGAREIAGRNRIAFPIVAKTNVATLWVLLPLDKPYHSFKLIKYDAATPKKVESVEPTYRFQMADGSLFGWMLVAPHDTDIYECDWTLRDE